MPRLDKFQEAHPDIDVWVSADMDVVDFAVEDVDVAIRYGGGRYSGLIVEHLMAEKIVPVCAPQLVTGDNPIKAPADLVHHTLLHDSSSDKDESCPHLAHVAESSGRLTTSRATVASNSISRAWSLRRRSPARASPLAKAALALADLEAGRLLIPFDLTTPTDFGYYIVHPPAKSSSKAVQAFVEWAKAEAATTADATESQAAA